MDHFSFNLQSILYYSFISAWHSESLAHDAKFHFLHSSNASSILKMSGVIRFNYDDNQVCRQPSVFPSLNPVIPSHEAFKLQGFQAFARFCAVYCTPYTCSGGKVNKHVCMYVCMYALTRSLRNFTLKATCGYFKEPHKDTWRLCYAYSLNLDSDWAKHVVQPLQNLKEADFQTSTGSQVAALAKIPLVSRHQLEHRTALHSTGCVRVHPDTLACPGQVGCDQALYSVPVPQGYKEIACCKHGWFSNI